MFKNNLITHVKKMLVPVLAGLALSLIIPAVFSILFVKVDMSAGMMTAAAFISLVFGGLLCGFFAGKNYRSKPAVIGLAAGVALFLLIFIVGLGFSKGLPDRSLLRLVTVCVSSVFGAVFGSNSKIRRKR